MTHELKALGVHIYAGGFTLGVSKHFEPLGHLEEGKKGYGSPSAKMNFPWLPMISGTENWKPFIQDLVGRRGKPDLVYCNPPCLLEDSKVFTERGTVSIGELVHARSTERVLSYDEKTKRMVYKPITGWHKNPYDRYVYSVTLPRHTRGGRKLAHVKVTDHHTFLTKRGWVRADELTPSDLVCTGQLAPNDQQRALIEGMLLGDSTIKKHQAQLVTSQISHEYVWLKQRALDDFICGSWTETEGADWGDGYTRKPRSGFYLKTQGWVKRERDRWYPNGVKRVPADLQLKPITLAAWYMDDGSGRSSNVVHLCTDGFPEHDVELLVTKLADLGVQAQLIKNGDYPRISISGDGLTAFMRLVAPYVLPEMRYKLRSLQRAPVGRPKNGDLLVEQEQLAEFDPNLWDLGEPEVDWDHVIVTRSEAPVKTNVFCLDVADTHNFTTYGGVVHNCAMFSVAGATMRGGGDAWRRDPRQSCWWNCFDVFKEIQPTIYAVESVTRAFTAGREFVDQFVELAKPMGYSATHVLLDAKWLGVPQTRKRYFLVLHKNEFSLPAPNWGPPKTAAEALTEVDDPGFIGQLTDPVQLEMLPKLKHGQAMRPLWERRMRETVGPEESWPRSANGVKGRPRLFLHRIDPNKPLGTITGDYFVHPNEDRMIGMNELKHFNGYPVDYMFEGHPRYWPSLIARGVSPTVAEYLARALKDSILGRPINEPTLTIADIQNPPKELNLA